MASLAAGPSKPPEPPSATLDPPELPVLLQATAAMPWSTAMPIAAAVAVFVVNAMRATTAC
jgi:hypothetical protein